MKKHSIYRDYFKRILDFSLSLIAFIILSPILGLIALLVRIKLGSPVVFKQPRPGKNERIFFLYKFRSMTNAVDQNGTLLPDSQRLTKFGKFLRASSMDELLELFNIIKGDMSIVGPRPLSIYYLPHYSEETRRRSEVRPGLTGLAQVNGRNNLGWDDRFKYDIEYVDNISFIGDIKIIFQTVFKVLKAENISVRGTTKVKDFGPYSILKEEGNMTVKQKGMTYSEIGSYFWMEPVIDKKSYELNWFPEVADSSFTLSGRTAIDIALQDIMKDKDIRKVYAPSYCCVSMLQSFVDRGIEIKFYDVLFENGYFKYDIDEHHGCDVVLIMSYFGLSNKEEEIAIKKLHDSGSIIIEDITHSLLREEPCSQYSDYLVASLRKWFAIPTGGWIGKKEGKLRVLPEMESDAVVSGKIEGMNAKYDYVSGKTQDKEKYLLLQSKFDNDLIHTDRLLKIDSVSLGILKETDVDEIKKKRCNNVYSLVSGLKKIKSRIITVPEISKDDVLLFLPVFLNKEDRNSLRKYLVDNGVYCPIHWPEVMGASMGVRDNELSLVCDQRYSENDMNAIIELIQEWHKARQKEGI